MDPHDFEMDEVVEEAYYFLLDDENDDYHVDDWQSEDEYWDYEPSPYDGTYSED